jgi:hypothetical protein
MQKNLQLLLAAAVLMLGHGIAGFIAGRATAEPTIIEVPIVKVEPAPKVVPVKVEPIKVDDEPGVDPSYISVVTKDDTVLSDDDAAPIIGTAEQGPGEYVYHGFRVGNRPLHYTISVRDGTAPIPPPVPPVPVPVPPVVVPGVREMLIVRDVKQVDPAFSQMVAKLRTGTAGAYIRDNKHRLFILDVGATGVGDKPSPLVEAWRPQFSGMKLPVEIIIDPATKAIVSKRELPATTKADDVIASLKKHGG